MKPPKLNKLSKKELKKLYSNQWNQNIIAVWENYNLNQALSVAEKQIKNYIEQSKERIEEKEKILEGIRKISNWNVTGFEHIKEGNLILVMQSYFDEKMQERENLIKEYNNQKEEIEDWKEATRRSRSLVQTYKEFAERKNPESVSIEKMAKNIYSIIKQEVGNTMESEVYYMDGWRATEVYEELQEETKDRFRVMATRIISEDPDKQNSPS